MIKNYSRFLFFCAGGAFLLSIGCASSKKYSATYPPPVTAFGQVVSNKNIDNTEHSVGLPEYRLGKGDVIEVRLFDNEVFNRTQAIRPDGRITLERIGDISVVGKTPTEVDEMITNRYKTFVIDPEVTVFVQEFGSQKIYVMGEVEKPGIYAVEGDMTFLQAIAAAGGAKNTAKLGTVVIMRKNGTGDVAPRKLNLLKFDQKKENQLEYRAMAQDVVFVPKTLVGNVSSFMSQFYSAFLPPVDVYLRALFWAK